MPSSDSREDAPQLKDEVSDALDAFEPIQNPVLFIGLRFLPWAILLLAIEEVVRAKWPLADYPMFYSGLLASSFSLLLFSLLMKRIPYTLGILWNREIIRDGVEAMADSERKEDKPDLTTSIPSPSMLEKQYTTYIHEFQELLNSPFQWASGITFALLVFTWHSYRYEDPTQIAEHLIAFVIGLMAWRMIVIGIQVWQLGRRFDIHPQLGHPDECGGLEPLGNLCLWNALILSILGVFLGGWILIGPSTKYDDQYTCLFYKLLLIPVGWAGVSFFLPLLSVHNILVVKREEVQQQLNQLGQRIDQLSHEILDRCHELDPEESEKMSKKLEILRQTYQQHENYPVWPFNADLIKKLTLSQTVQVLSLTGLGKPILSAVQIIVDIMKGLPK